jgi:hypothetical protein
MKSSLLVVLSFFVLISCKNEKAETSSSEKVGNEVSHPNFTIEIIASAAQKDDFALYFTEDNTINFTSENALWTGIEPAKENKLVFELKEERVPTHIRVDLGLNKQQDSVVIYKMKLAYLNKSFEFKGSEFFQFFNQDPQFKTKINPVNGTLTVYKNGDDYQTPFFYPNEQLANSIKELIIN